jgi:hypothetical protein
MQFSKCILEVVFCGGGQCLLLGFCLDLYKMAAFKFYLESGKQGKVDRVGKTAMLVLVKNSLVKREV